MSPCQDDIGSLGGQRQVVLEKHLDVFETRVDEVASQNRQASCPRLLLGIPGTSPSAKQHLLQQLLRE
ncbi:hypothetical protein M1M07_29770 [Rhodococcus sp. HM1]|uniref:hypothetical protein n=1 Tax=Rhodococcus sp. HM1 TaxID=2937759 RepID=UPI00200A36D0|nr:hypothetical protein [Rhodococcus sp. HM1]MCK8675283.1 hypothetical protein [Rhodococcus sp. HM1]